MQRFTFFFLFLLLLAAPIHAWAQATPNPMRAPSGYTMPQAAEPGDIFEKMRLFFARLFGAEKPAAPAPLTIAPIQATEVAPQKCVAAGVSFNHNTGANFVKTTFKACTPDVKDQKKACAEYRCVNGKWYPEAAFNKPQKKPAKNKK